MITFSQVENSKHFPFFLRFVPPEAHSFPCLFPFLFLCACIFEYIVICMGHCPRRNQLFGCVIKKSIITLAVRGVFVSAHA